MILFIDGYNLLKQLYGSNVGQNERDVYIHTLQRYCRIKKHKIIIIFDGGLYSHPVKEELSSNFVLMYAGHAATADDVIKEHLVRYANKEVLLVSADRELVRYAYAHNVTSVEPLHFNSFVMIALKENNGQQVVAADQDQITKLHCEENNTALDDLMEQASQSIVYKDDESPVINEADCTKKLSKKERLYQTIIKKL